MSEIEIPDRAVRATYGAPFTEGVTNKSIRAVLKSAGPVVVATELRRLADWLACDDGTREDLRERADELDPQGGVR